MKPFEKKRMCDLISLVADAVATQTIREAEDYLTDHFDDLDNQILEHTFNVLTKIHNKQTI